MIVNAFVKISLLARWLFMKGCIQFSLLL